MRKSQYQILFRKSTGAVNRSFHALAGFSDQNTTFSVSEGKNWASEIEIAQNHWSFDYDAIKSETDGNAVILKIRGLSRV